MNLIKHMEAVFIAATLLTVGGAVLIETAPHAHATPVKSFAAPAAAPVTSPAATPTVVIKARRMTAQEKARASGTAI